MSNERTSSSDVPNEDPNVTFVDCVVPVAAAARATRLRRPLLPRDGVPVLTGPTWPASHLASGLLGGLAFLRCGQAAVTLPPRRSCFFLAALATGAATATAAMMVRIRRRSRSIWDGSSAE